MINRITLVAAFIGILAIGSWVFTLLDSEEGDYAYGRPAGNLTLGIQLRNSSIGYVSDGGLGELIQINVSMKSKGDTWESVYELGNSDTDTDSKLFCVWVVGRDSKPVSITPTAIEWGSFRGDENGSESHFRVDVPIHSLQSAGVLTSEMVNLQVSLNDEILPRILADTAVHEGPLVSGVQSIDLVSVPLRAASFSQRLRSLRPGLTSSDIERTIGRPLSKQVVEERTRKDWPNLATRWEYENPDLDGSVPADRRKVTLYFDPNGRLVVAWQALYGC
jgi:hypothetical protein